MVTKLQWTDNLERTAVQPPKRLHTPQGHTLAGGGPRVACQFYHGLPPPPTPHPPLPTPKQNILLQSVPHFCWELDSIRDGKESTFSLESVRDARGGLG